MLPVLALLVSFGGHSGLGVLSQTFATVSALGGLSFDLNDRLDAYCCFGKLRATGMGVRRTGVRIWRE